MAKLNKGFNNPNSLSNFENNTSQLFDYTMSNVMDNLFAESLDVSVDNVFKAVCLSGMEAGDNTGGGTSPMDATAAKYINIVVRPLTAFGNILPDPRLFKDDGGKKITDIISMHSPMFTAKSDDEFNTAEPIDFGQIVDCYFEKGSIRNSNFRQLRFIQPTSKIIDISFQSLSLVEDFKTVQAYFGDGDTMLLGGVETSGFPEEHAIVKLEREVIPSTEVIEGVGSEVAVSLAYLEINFWNGKNESDVGTKASLDKTTAAYKRIQLYHYYVQNKGKPGERPWTEYFTTYENDPEVLKSNIVGNSKKGTADGTTGIEHWSATSVSWCMRQSEFPAYYGHSFYSQNIASGKSPKWKLHSLLRERCKAKLGDVVVMVGKHGKEKTVNTASHGDIIYRIEGTNAYTCGGNLGSRGAFKQNRTIKLDENGIIIDPGDYLIILKKIA